MPFDPSIPSVRAAPHDYQHSSLMISQGPHLGAPPTITIYQSAHFFSTLHPCNHLSNLGPAFATKTLSNSKALKDIPHTLPSQPAWLSRSPGTTRVRSIYPSSRTRPTCGRRLLPASILRMDNPLFSLLKHVQLHLQLALLCPSPRFRRYRHRHLGVSPGHPQTTL